MTIWHVRWNHKESFQLYACADGSYELVGIHQRYERALVDLKCWINELAAGATLAGWRTRHPDGCTATIWNWGNPPTPHGPARRRAPRASRRR
jgi:hypothetical protein